jgi:hypothetical protein
VVVLFNWHFCGGLGIALSKGKSGNQSIKLTSHIFSGSGLQTFQLWGRY